MSLESIRLTTHRLNPAEAEIRVAGAEKVIGRVMGPRCHYASTVEVAYYFKPLPGGGARVLVPEPSYWDPQAPLLYEAILELSDGKKWTRQHGLRTLQWAPAGWRVNRKPFRVQGIKCDDLSDARALRAKGINTIVCPVSAATRDVWHHADVLGFFVLGLLGNNADALALAREHSSNASCLGWIVDDADAIEPHLSQLDKESFFGLRTTSPDVATPPWIRFLAGPESLSGSHLPWLLLGDDEDIAATLGIVRTRLPV